MFKKFIYYIAPVLLKVVLSFIFMTCKWKISNKESLDLAQKKALPILICCWHSRFILVARYFKKISLGAWAISSTHRDSEIMATILCAWNFRLIKGSSTRGWRNVIKKMINLFHNKNSIITLTNDGPKGPAYVAKPGSVALAKKCGAQILTVSGTATKYWILPSWDKTIIPKPFSTIHIQFATTLNNDSLLSNESAVVSKYMNDNFNDLNNKVNQ